MANSFDFNKIKKKYFNITLPDGTKLQLKMPSKKIFEKLKEIKTGVGSTFAEQADAVYALSAEILSGNLEKKVITPKYAADNFDIEDLSIFLTAYDEYVEDQNNNPN